VNGTESRFAPNHGTVTVKVEPTVIPIFLSPFGGLKSGGQDTLLRLDGEVGLVLGIGQRGAG
jgi:hypothetical protein